jgi:hypothetical protein
VNKNRVSGLCHELVQLEREFFFGTEDEQRWMPEFQKEYSAIMCPPFMGEKYNRKGLLLLGINPGVGKSNNLNQGDELLYTPLSLFKDSEDNIDEIYWQKFVPAFVKAKKTFPIYSQHVEPSLLAAKKELEQICYLNILQYRCNKNNYPKGKKDLDKIMPKTINNFAKPFLSLADPGMVVFLGQWVKNQIYNYWDDFPYEHVVWDREQASTERRELSRKKCLNVLEEWFDE